MTHGKTALVLVFSTAPIALWWHTSGNPLDYLKTGVPPGQLLYALSKLAGVVGVSLIGLQITSVILANQRLIPPTRGAFHATVGLVTLLVALSHAALFFFAATQRSEGPALALLTLRFSAGFYNAMVSLGLIALGLLILAVLLGLLRYADRGPGRLKALHGMLMAVMCVLAVVHSVSIGSDTKSLPAIIFYSMTVGSLCWLLVQLGRRRLRTSQRKP